MLKNVGIDLQNKNIHSSWQEETEVFSFILDLQNTGLIEDVSQEFVHLKVLTACNSFFYEKNYKAIKVFVLS